MGTSTTSILQDAQELAPEITKLRHDLHRTPEVGLQLPRTQEKVLQWLEPLGYEVSLGKDLTSVTAVLRGGAGAQQPVGERPTVLLRGDMDGLPLVEKTEIEFASQTGQTMHACGHDLHTSMLAGAATLLAERRESLSGDVVLMFQPGEEGWDGASYMVREGVLEASGTKVDAAFGLHVMSAMEQNGMFTTKPGSVMSASDGLFVTVHGAGGHGSAPFAAKDPVTAAAEMVGALQTMVTRQFNIFDPVVISVGVLRAGTVRNIIPETAYFEATIRSFSDEAHEKLQVSVPALLRGIAQAHGLEVTVRYETEYPTTINDEAETAFATHAVAELFDSTAFTAMRDPLAGSEDFSRVLNEVPGSFMFLSALTPGTDLATANYNHSPYAVFDDSVLSRGTALYTHLAVSRLQALSASAAY
ncbi:amidohydrolase [Arthrobacter sp. MYb227]|uniref:M20 metallopeptidase family protein n=1 Tax=Arthrobacter sp. MYb227 TaxID=1848601 RepID=UPI000CFD6F17|nr:M20 family metallopeptidase [Arthrobacter sp. MYb227]PQZ86692.1 amidohydrolase [Arthrobacter sp. MYb227]